MQCELTIIETVKKNLVLDKRGMTSWYEWSGYCPEIINLRKTACRITELRRKGILFLMEDGGQDKKRPSFNNFIRFSEMQYKCLPITIWQELFDAIILIR